MDTIDDQLLNQRLLDGVLSETEIWDLLRSLLPTIQSIHQTNRLVRTLQPEVIGQIRSTHGQSFQLSDRWQTISPSPEHTAPEQLVEQATVASDIYSLGVVCLQGLTGVSPFELWDTTTDQWCWLPYLPEAVSPQLQSVLSKMVARNLTDRYSTIAAILTELGWRELMPVPQNAIHWQCQHTLNGHRQAVTDLVGDWPHQRLYSASHDKTIGIWDLPAGRLIDKLLHHQRSVTSLTLHPSGNFLAAASDDKTISIWDLAQNQIVQSLVGHTQAVKSIHFTPDGATLISASWDKSIRYWDWRSAQNCRSLTGHRLKIGTTDLSSDGCLLVSGSHDRTARIWDIQQGHTLHVLEGHEWAVTAVAFSPDRQWVATGSDDHTIKIWNVETGHLAQTLPGHSWDIGCLLWRSSSELISGSWNPAIKVWDWASGQSQTMQAHDDFITSISINGNQAVTGSGDRTIKLWQLD